MPNYEQTIIEINELSHVTIHNISKHGGACDRATEAMNLGKQPYAVYKTTMAI